MIQNNAATFPPQNSPVVDQNNNLTLTWMGFLRALFNRTGMGTGIPFQVSTIADVNNSQVTTDWILGNTSVSDNGVLSLPVLSPGQFIVVQSSGAEPLIVTPSSGVTIDGASDYSLTAGKMQIFWCFTTSQIFSTQLG